MTNILEKFVFRYATKLYRMGLETHGYFVDLPNGNKGMIRYEILDFGITSGNPAPKKITAASYVVDAPELKIALRGIET